MLAWRARFLRWLEEIVPLYPPRVEVDISDLADQMTIIADGSIIMQRALADPTILERQALLHRAMVRRLFLDSCSVRVVERPRSTPIWMLRLWHASVRPIKEKGWTKCNHGILEASALLRGFCPHLLACSLCLRRYTMKGSLLIGTRPE